MVTTNVYGNFSYDRLRTDKASGNFRNLTATRTTFAAPGDPRYTLLESHLFALCCRVYTPEMEMGHL